MATIDEINKKAECIRSFLENNGIATDSIVVEKGLTVSLYKVKTGSDVTACQFLDLKKTMRWRLGLKGLRVYHLEGGVIGIEVANEQPEYIPLETILAREQSRMQKLELPVLLGYTFGQELVLLDLQTAPNLLVSGVSSPEVNRFLESAVESLKIKNVDVRVIDPTSATFSIEETDKSLENLKEEVSRRLVENSIKHPNTVVVINNYTDIALDVIGDKLRSRSIRKSIIQLAQRGRKAGVHIILATNCPSVDVLSLRIKTYFPARIAFQTKSRLDSMTILDSPGAECLIGDGDMLFSKGDEIKRIQMCDYT